MKFSVYIATSADGYIADPDGGVDWLHSAGNADAEMGVNADMGFADFIDSVDCMIMGRRCMEVIASFNLSPEQWPYGDIPIIVLSHTLKEPPESLHGKVEIYAGEITALISELEKRELKHAYVDGGTTITSFVNLALINQMTITKAPVLLGDGLPLFGRINRQIKLVDAEAEAFPNDFIQIKYRVDYQ
ncbi:dihydrofolate reductase [Sinobacterium caligoides]|uniref:Dihydrofolate reductase n=1 Tax=Sinobacterium caligoides TaxID=933926 RepID=A0A3N2DQC2_9GAMM|nr:dihydrofolate reductase family protein [Sinobacterium caligoides]ROS02031.1 dihydrofolate reductase [Sinobacterium caligoides]